MISVLRASVDDAAMVAHVLRDLYGGEPAGATGLAPALRDPGFVLYLAYSDGACVGYLHGQMLSRLDGDRMLLVYEIGVDRAHRRQGVATELMRNALRLAADSGAVRCWLLTAADNAAARGLYESLDAEEFPAIGFAWHLA